MNHYEPSTPRAALGVAAVAMTAITVALAVIGPAKMGTGDRKLVTLAASKVVPPRPAEVVINPARINVVAVCGPRSELLQAGNAPSKRKQQG
jgi:hypothetical protein